MYRRGKFALQKQTDNNFGSTVELQRLEHRWLVYHGCFELIFESFGTNPIVADLELFRMIFCIILRNDILCVLFRIASLRRF